MVFDIGCLSFGAFFDIWCFCLIFGACYLELVIDCWILIFFLFIFLHRSFQSTISAGFAMKKVFIGCGIAVLVVLLVLGVVGYHVVKFAKSVGDEVNKVGEQFEALDAQLAFQVPPDGLIRKDRFDAWVDIRLKTAGETDAFIEAFDDFSLKKITSLRDQSFSYIYSVTDAMETAGMSPKEYSWISQQVVGVLDSGDGRSNPALREIVIAFDDLSDTDEDFSNRKQNLHTLGIPVTSDQIERTTRLLVARKDDILTSMKVFYADAIVTGINEQFRRRQHQDDWKEEPASVENT